MKAKQVEATKDTAVKVTAELKIAEEEATAKESAAKETDAKESEVLKIAEEEATAKETVQVEKPEEEAEAKEAAKKVDKENYARGENNKKVASEKPAPRTSFLWYAVLFPILLVVPQHVTAPTTCLSP